MGAAHASTAAKKFFSLFFADQGLLYIPLVRTPKQFQKASEKKVLLKSLNLEGEVHSTRENRSQASTRKLRGSWSNIHAKPRRTLTFRKKAQETFMWVNLLVGADKYTTERYFCFNYFAQYGEVWKSGILFVEKFSKLPRGFRVCDIFAMWKSARKSSSRCWNLMSLMARILR